MRQLPAIKCPSVDKCYLGWCPSSVWCLLIFIYFGWHTQKFAPHPNSVKCACDRVKLGKNWGKRKETNEFKEKESVNLKVMERRFLKLLCGWMEMEKRTKLDLNISNRETLACPWGKVIEIKIYRENYCFESSQPNCHLQPPTRWVGRWEEEMASWKCQIWINSANLLQFSLKTTAEKCKM